jgi:hypothetical protein
MRTNIFVSTVVAAVLAAGSAVALAQNATAPGRETPRPQDVEPRVNTSAPSPNETPRPQDIEPGVNTSTPPSEAASSGTSSTAEGAAAPSATPPSTSATASKNASSQAKATSTASAPKGKALDRLELDTTQITGNRELPKVLYIVPWKRSDLGDLVGKPINSLLDEVLTPVDRDVFQRENRYYRALTPGAAENDALSAPDARPPTPVRNPVPTNSAPAAGSPGSATQPTNASANGGSTASGSAASPRRDEK